MDVVGLRLPQSFARLREDEVGLFGSAAGGEEVNTSESSREVSAASLAAIWLPRGNRVRWRA